MRQDYYGKIRERMGPYVEGAVDKARNAGVAAANAVKNQVTHAADATYQYAQQNGVPKTLIRGAAQALSGLAPAVSRGMDFQPAKVAPQSTNGMFEAARAAAQAINNQGLNKYPRGFQDGNRRRPAPTPYGIKKPDMRTLPKRVKPI